MATKNILASQVLDILTKGKYQVSESHLNKRYIMSLIDRVYPSLVRQSYYEHRQLTGEFYVSDSFFQNFPEVKIKKETNTNRLYLDLPGALLGIPHDLGLIITYPEDVTSEFKMQRIGAQSAWGKLESANLGGYYGYTVEGQKVYFGNLPKDWNNKTLHIRMVTSTEALDEDDPYPIPPDMEGALIQAVIRLYAPQENMIEDLENDNE